MKYFDYNTIEEAANDSKSFTIQAINIKNYLETAKVKYKNSIYHNNKTITVYENKSGGIDLVAHTSNSLIATGNEIGEDCIAVATISKKELHEILENKTAYNELEIMHALFDKIGEKATGYEIDEDFNLEDLQYRIRK